MPSCCSCAVERLAPGWTWTTPGAVTLSCCLHSIAFSSGSVIDRTLVCRMIWPGRPAAAVTTVRPAGVMAADDTVIMDPEDTATMLFCCSCCCWMSCLARSCCCCCSCFCSWRFIKAWVFSTFNCAGVNDRPPEKIKN